MKKLLYRLTNDILFKMLFVQYPHLLKKLVAELLGIPHDDITEFVIRNPEIPPDAMGDKFCRLDINMIVNGQRVDLEVQVENEGNYPERSLFIWAREFSTAITEGQDYSELPRTIVISILGFKLFKDAKTFHSEFQVLEVTRREALTDKCALHFFELPKLSQQINGACGKELWLKLFKAETEDDLAKLEALEVPVMNEAVQAYRHVAASPEFRERERLWSKARFDEAQALNNAARKAAQKAEERANKRWQRRLDSLATQNEAALANKDAENAELRAKVEALLQQLDK